MPRPGVALEKLGFLTIGLFDGENPGPGHQATLEIIELGERLGFDSAWVRHRHLQYGISSPVAVLAAASQRTSRIEFGTAVNPLGWENPLRLAEDLATVDNLVRRPAQPRRQGRAADALRGRQGGAVPGHRRPRGLRLRAGRAVAAPCRRGAGRFVQRHRGVSQGLVGVIPTDSASAAQRYRYEAYVEARTPRTASPAGPARMMFARDLIGPSSDIAAALYAHAAFREVTEVAFALPFTFEHEDYVQILTDMATRLGPALGWQPRQ
jgi:hypothetical protein